METEEIQGLAALLNEAHYWLRAATGKLRAASQLCSNWSMCQALCCLESRINHIDQGLVSLLENPFDWPDQDSPLFTER
jgi:hypothetical protein